MTTYDQRMALTKEWFRSKVTTRFTMPNGIDPNIVASDIIESINAAIPSEYTDRRFSELLADISAEVARRSRSRTLPPVRDFLIAAGASVKKMHQSHGEAHTLATTVSSIPTYLRITEARIRAREPVADFYVRGSGKAELLEKTGLTEEDFEPYYPPAQKGKHNV